MWVASCTNPLQFIGCSVTLLDFDTGFFFHCRVICTILSQILWKSLALFCEGVLSPPSNNGIPFILPLGGIYRHYVNTLTTTMIFCEEECKQKFYFRINIVKFFFQISTMVWCLAQFVELLSFPIFKFASLLTSGGRQEYRSYASYSRSSEFIQTFRQLF